MRFFLPVLIGLIGLTGAAASADVVVLARTIRANTIIGAEDLLIKNADVAGAYSHIVDVIGQEARVALYAGRPVRAGDVGPPAIIERNQIVPLIYQKFGLRISTPGRALGRGAEGDMVRVMNMSSRSTLFGLVRRDGSVVVN